MVQLLVLLLIGLAGDAQAEWVKIQELSLSASYYVQPSSLQVDTRIKNNQTPYKIRVVGWYLINYPLTDTMHKSVLYQIEDDCLEFKHRVLTAISFNEPMARGYPNFVSTVPQQWITEEKEQFEARRWSLSCSDNENK